VAELALTELLTLMEQKDASDLHLHTGIKPVMRIKGHLVTLDDHPEVEEGWLHEALYELVSDKKMKQFEEEGTVDAAAEIPGVGRFRMSVYLRRGTIALACRRITKNIPSFEQLHLPPSIAKITEFPLGLVLATGPTGCGKSTTLAALINHINHTRKCHIICIEDPIEFVYENDKAIITQREVGNDVKSFQDALKYSVRQDPDVILVGEIRDLPTLEFALHGAETGHLVFGTLHSADATQTIERILNFYPQNLHPQVRKTISMHLKAVVSQILLPGIRPDIPLLPACEIMFMNPTISRLIKEGQDDKIIRAIKAGQRDGMQDMEFALYERVVSKLVAKEVAMEFAENPQSLEMKIKGIFLGEEGGIIG